MDTYCSAFVCSDPHLIHQSHVSFRLATVVSLHDSLETDVMRRLPRKLGSVEASQVWANLTRDHALLGASSPQLFQATWLTPQDVAWLSKIAIFDCHVTSRDVGFHLADPNATLRSVQQDRPHRLSSTSTASSTPTITPRATVSRARRRYAERQEYAEWRDVSGTSPKCWKCVEAFVAWSNA